jgi:hypothetical protein
VLDLLVRVFEREGENSRESGGEGKLISKICKGFLVKRKSFFI